MKPVCIIPAKGYSKRLYNKNKKLLNGQPLFQLAVDAACISEVFDKVILSTDDYEIYNGSNTKVERDAHAACYQRHNYLSRPGVGYNAVVFDLLSQYSYNWDSFCVLIPSSPLRTPELIRDIYAEFVKTDADCMMTFSQGHGVHDGTAIFARTVPFLRALDFHRMDYVTYNVCPNLSCDVNTQEDLDRAKEMFERRNKVELANKS